MATTHLFNSPEVGKQEEEGRMSELQEQVFVFGLKILSWYHKSECTSDLSAWCLTRITGDEK